ncbi:MAG: hypothetical protein AB1597_02210 [Chloroflexota bacterium]
MLDDNRFFSRLKGEARDQTRKEKQFLEDITSELGSLEDLQTFEGDLAARRKEILFKVTTEMEDTQNALKKAEDLVARLKKHQQLLEGLQRLLAK